MAERSSRSRVLVAACAAAGVAIGVWLVMDRERQAPSAVGDPHAEPVAPIAPESGSVPVARGPAAPAHRIAEGGRLAIDAASLRDGEALALGLALGDEARGVEPLAVVIVSVDGRRIETTAVPVAGGGSGLRLELDPAWLVPGRYMIEVTTAEKIPLHLRRYVLEVE